MEVYIGTNVCLGFVIMFLIICISSYILAPIYAERQQKIEELKKKLEELKK